MPLTNPTVGELYTFSSSCYNVFNPNQKWTNNLTMYTEATTTLTNLQQAALRFGQFVSYVSLQSTIVEKVRISTYEPDTNPYQGNEFTNVDLNLAGQRGTSTDDALALEVSLYIKKQTAVGRSGKLFLRGVLREGDVSFGQSLFAPTNAANLASLIDNGLVESGFDSNVTATDQYFSVCLAKLDAGEYLIRRTNGFLLGGIRMVNMNHRYYDRV